MIIWMIRLLVVIAGPIIGYFQWGEGPQGVLLGTAVAAGIIIIEMMIEKIPLDDLVAGILGAIIGLIGAKLLDYAVSLIGNQNLTDLYMPYSILIKMAFGYFGLLIAIRKKEELNLLDQNISKAVKGQDLKILDTSAIIDGRIADVCDAKFLDGVFIVPRFILKELQTVADSGDSMKRSRGRRGLEILNRLQENKNIQLRIFEKDYPETAEADIKIVKLATELKAKVITTDFNLNKIAALSGVIVLNVNELSNAVKPMVIPGEMMQVMVVKEGKEHSQGIAYLEDGTMVVVEEGRKKIGEKLEVVVTSVLQTTAGRMIFTRLKSKEDK
ncbi:MAG: TRAM domain-containing protein [bacterium]|nr:TRAM domain-containing protein [bacterium]MDD5756791.1 TRAM domain-containing protein [bacterium]